MTVPRRLREKRLTGAERPPATEAGVLRLLAHVGSPIALATSLLLFFGWTRTRAEARTFGYDVSVTGMSAQDFVLKSVLILYVPVLILLIAAIGLAWLHAQAIRIAQGNTGVRRALAWFAEALVTSWPIWLVLGVFAVLFLPPLRLFAIPALLTVALVSIMYGDHLRSRLHRRDRLPSAMRTLLIATLLLAVFWDTERVAGAVGSAYASQIASDPRQLVAVTVSSPKRLGIAVPGIVESKLTAADSAYPYRYDGLRLLQVSGGRYFLISQDWSTANRRVLVIKITDPYRVEFSR